MSAIIEDMYEEKEYDLDLVGNLGRFVSSNSYPVEYFLTSLPIFKAVRYLKFARDIQMDKVDFDLLMQRDIDIERVEKDIIPYLQKEKSDNKRPLFFPPLLAAIVPINDKDKMQDYYGEKEENINHLSLIGNKWNGNFQTAAKRIENSDGFPLNLDDQKIKVNSSQALLRLRTSEANSSGIALVVIDGQHRLMALKHIYDNQNSRDVIKDLIVPVCILYPPNSHIGNKHLESIPKVPWVFRNLFVDVNSTMKVVGGHFNILLSDKNVADITCRYFCDNVLKKYDKVGLASIEWNTRSKKDAANVTKKYTATSIGIIQKALEQNLKTESSFFYVFGVNEAADDLFPQEADPDEYYSKIKWDTYSYNQAKALSSRSLERLVPLLLNLFFESTPYGELWAIFNKEINKLKDEEKENGRKGICANAVLKNILDYAPLHKDQPEFIARLDDFESAVEDQRNQAGLNILRYALFQRALFDVAGCFLKRGDAYGVSPNQAYKGFIKLVDLIFEKNRKIFSSNNTFLNYVVFQNHKIRAKEDTRHAFRDIILSHLIIDEYRSEIVKAGYPESDTYALNKDFNKIGFKAAGDYMSKYRSEREKNFRKAYDVDYSLSPEQRESLKTNEMKQKNMEKEVQEGKRDSASVVRYFDNEVKKYVDQYVIEVHNDLKSSLGVSIDLIESIVDGNSDDDGVREE